MLNNCAFGLATLSLSPKIYQTILSIRHVHRSGRPGTFSRASQGSFSRTPSSAAAANSSSVEEAKQLTKRIKSATTPVQLFDTLKLQQDMASVRHLSFALHHLSKLQPPSLKTKNSRLRNHPDIIWIVNEILKREDDIWEDISIANVLEACHTLRLGSDFPELLIKAETELAKPRRRPSNWRTVTSLLTALAKLGRKMDTHPYLQAVHASLLSNKTPKATKKGTNNNTDAASFTKNAEKLNLQIKLEDFEDFWGLAWALTELECSPKLADAVVSHVSFHIGFKSLSPRPLLFLTRLAAERGSSHRALPTAQDVATALTRGRWEEVIKSPTPGLSARDLSMLFFNLAKLVRMAASTDLNSEIDPAMWHKMEQRVTQIDGSSPDLQAAIRLLQRALAPLVETMEAHEISSVASALAQMQRTKSALLPMLAARATELAPTMGSMGLCMIARALASLQFDSEQFIEAAARALRQHLINSSDINSDFTDVEKNQNINPRGRKQQNASAISPPSIQGLIAMLYSLAVLDRCDGPAVQQLLPELIPRLIPALPELDPVESNYLPLVGWSLMVAKGPPLENGNSIAKESLFQALRAWRSAIIVAGHRIPPRQLAMVQHVDVALRIECPNLGADAPAQYDAFFNSLYDSGRLRFRAGAEWSAQKDRVLDTTTTNKNERNSSSSSTSSDSDSGYSTDSEDNNKFGYQKNGSRFQREVYAALCQVIHPAQHSSLSSDSDYSSNKTSWEFEYWEPNLWYPVDAALPAYKLAVEADGPTHYATNTLRPLGHTLLKRRLLKQLGWIVVNIPMFEWIDVVKSDGDNVKEEYLVKKIEKALGGMKIEEFLKAPVVAVEDKQEEKEIKVVVINSKATSKSEEDNSDEAIANRALRLDLINVKRGKLTKSQLALNEAMRRTTSTSQASIIKKKGEEK